LLKAARRHHSVGQVGTAKQVNFHGCHLDGHACP
jgi:hypothetical protein